VYRTESYFVQDYKRPLEGDLDESPPVGTPFSRDFDKMAKYFREAGCDEKTMLRQVEDLMKNSWNRTMEREEIQRRGEESDREYRARQGERRAAPLPIPPLVLNAPHMTDGELQDVAEEFQNARDPSEGGVWV